MSNNNQNNDYSASYHVPIPTHVYTTSDRKQNNQQTTTTNKENTNIKQEKRSCLEKIKLGFYIGILSFCEYLN